MKQKVIPFGETHPVKVIKASKSLIIVHATDNNQAYVLIHHGIQNLPVKEENGTIEFKMGGPTGGYWHFIPSP